MEGGLVEESYFQIVKKRGMDPCHEDFQVFAYASKLQAREYGEVDACRQSEMMALSATAGSTGLESKFEAF